MDGELRGAFFKSVVNALLMGEVLVPEYVQRVEAMADDGWYPWSEYLEIVGTLSRKMSDATLKKCGMQLMLDGEEFYRSIGFESMSDQMHGFEAGFNASVRNAPEAHRVKVLESDPGHARLRFGAVQPRGLIEGYFIGAAKIYGVSLVQLDHELLAEGEAVYHVFDVRWLEHA